MNPTPGRTSSEVIIEAIQGLENSGRKANRRVICEVTGLRMSIVDDHVTRLVEADRLRRLGGGIVELVKQFRPSRPISTTVLLDGEIKLEIGDSAETFTPHEWRVIGMLSHGAAMEFTQIRGEREAADTVQAMSHELKKQRQQIAEMATTIAKMKRQGQKDLFDVTDVSLKKPGTLTRS